MKKIITSRLCFLLFFMYFSSISFSQTIINYQTWTGASGCNIFASLTNVPATINGTNSNIAHLTAIGQPTYDNVNKSVNLVSEIINSSQNQGTEYRTTVNFKLGYSYTITINAARIMSQQTGANVLLRLDLNNGGSGGNTLCNGTGIIDANASGNLKQSLPITLTSFADYIFNYSSLSAAQTYLMVAAIPPAGSVYQTILIRKITIVETPPPPSFTVSPTSVSKVCGTALTQTFTANGSNIPQGATVSYLWNLGSASNGWLYNSAPAPQTITTTANTLSLTAVACGIAPGNNITVTATVNGTNYNAGTVTVSAAAFSINGPATICSGGTPPTYSILNLGCSPTVSWSASPLNIVNIGTPNLPTTSISYANSGTVTLTANYTSACGNGSLTKTISAGNPMPTGTSSYSSNCSANYFNVLNTSLSTICSANTIIDFNYNIVDSRFSNFVWTPVSVPAGATWYGNGSNLQMAVRTPTSQGQNSETIALSATGPCGVYNVNFTSSAAYVGGFNFTVAPNPSQDNVTVSSDNQTLSKSSSQNLIYAIKITDHFGTLRKSVEYKSGVTSIKISLTELNSGLYLISVFDGNKWNSKQLVIQK